MSMTRSQFLGTLGAAVAFAVTGSGRRLLASGLVASVSNLGSERFANAVSSTFTIQVDGRSVDLVLDRVARMKTSVSTDQFSLIFHCPTSSRIPEGKYPARHAKLGEFEVFIVPSGYNEQNRQEFRAEFNLLLVPAETVRKR